MYQNHAESAQSSDDRNNMARSKRTPTATVLTKGLWTRTGARGAARLAVWLLLCSFAWGQDVPVRRVLILYEVGTSYPAVNLIDEGIRQSFKGTPYQVIFYRDYMETILFPDGDDQKHFREFFVRKYVERQPDVIITTGSGPLRLMAEVHGHSFGKVPVIFCLPNGMEKLLALQPDFTGVTREIKAAETIDAALTLLPRTKNVFVVSGSSPF